jgi:hypothetical protein
VSVASRARDAERTIRRLAREHSEAENINVWAGEAHSLARAEPAASVVEGIVAEAGPALRRSRPAAHAARSDSR